MKPILILGSGNSGSSAVLDYLRGRPDVADPLGGQEFRLLQERDGLSSLHRSLAMELHPDDAMYAVIRFARLAARLGADSKKLRLPPKLGYGFSRRVPGYDAAIAEFLNGVTACRIGTYPLQDLLRLSTLDWVRFMTGRFPRGGNVVTHKPIPVPEEEFLRRAKALISRLFFEVPRAPEIRALVFDQGGSFWSPVSSTQYFGEERRVIVVPRDPCDVYASQRRKSKIEGTAEQFSRYQDAIVGLVRREEWLDERVLKVTFEDLVLDHENQVRRICSHAGLDPAVKSSYNPADSRKSVGRSEELLTASELAAIRRAAPWPPAGKERR